MFAEPQSHRHHGETVAAEWLEVGLAFPSCDGDHADRLSLRARELNRERRGPSPDAQHERNVGAVQIGIVQPDARALPAEASARFTATVVLPTPPLQLAIARTCRTEGALQRVLPDLDIERCRRHDTRSLAAGNLSCRGELRPEGSVLGAL